MSTTPRPWKRDGFSIIRDSEEWQDIASDLAEPDDGDLIVRAVNAFAALLAVANAAAQDVADSEKDMSPIGQIADAIDLLDAAHPGWREWGP